MTLLKKNVLLTGAPSSGKTTVIKEIIKKIGCAANGFFTEEERINGKRVGFVMNTLDGKRGYLAHQNIMSDYHIRRYGVSIDNIETIAISSILPSGNNIIILDEIGKMECFSGAFKKAVVKALDSSNIVLGTITLGGDDFILAVKNRPDVEIYEVSPENRDSLPDRVIQEVSDLLRCLSKEKSEEEI